MTVWQIVLVVALVWAAISIVLALLIGAVIRMRDRREGPRRATRADRRRGALTDDHR